MFWMVLLSLLFTSVQPVPDVKISTCGPPVVHNNLSVCCFVKDLPDGASVFFSKNFSQVARISQSCDLWFPNKREDANFSVSCSRQVGNQTIYNITFSGETYSSDEDLYTWECGFYGRKASMNLTVLDAHSFVTHSPGSTASLLYTLSDLKTDSGTVRVFKLPLYLKMLEVNVTDNTIIYQDSRIVYTGDVASGKFTFEIRNVTFLDNGTYVCLYVNRPGTPVYVGVSVVVLGRPHTPIISSSTQWTVTGNKASGSVTCDAVSGSAAPLFYKPEYEISWYYPSPESWPPGDTGYKVSTNESTAYISVVECERLSVPVYCEAEEEGLRSDTSLGFYPNTMCPDKTASSDEDGDPRFRALVILTILFVSTTVFVAVIATVIGRRFLKRKSRRCLRNIRKCCLCCAKCLPSSDSDSDSDSDLERTIRHSLDDLDRPRRPRPALRLSRPMEVSLDDGLRMPASHNSDVQRALERIAMEESRQIYERQMHQDGLDNPVYGGGDNGDRAVANSVSSEDSLVVQVGNLRGAEGGARERRGARASMSDDVTVLKEVESLLKQHHDHLSENVVRLQINRGSIVDNLIAYYTDESLALSRVTVSMVGEEGMDCGGITFDMYTTFWARAQERFFIGCERVVPELPAHRFAEENNFRVLGRILSHSVAVMKALPVHMCKSTIIAMIYNTTEVAQETLLEDFLYFLDEHERSLVTTAINNYSSLTGDQVDELSTVFERFNYGALPSEDTIAHHVTQLARHVTCIRPRQLLELMRSGIPEVHMEHFWSRFHIRTLDVLFMALKPSADRIIARLKVDEEQRDMFRRQGRVLQFLKDLLKEMSEPELETFLHFVTGKKCIPRDHILVQFTTESGSLRLPKAHTCSSMLELPETYENYDTFRSELKHLMASDEALTMTME